MTAKKSTAKKNEAAEKTAAGNAPANTPAGKAAATGSGSGSATGGDKSTQPYLQHLCIAFIGDTLTVYQNTGGRAAWQVLPVQGEESYAHDDRADSLDRVLQDVRDNLNLEDGLKGTDITLVYAQPKQFLLTDFMARLHRQGNGYWQVLRWENLYARARYLLHMCELAGEPSPQWMIDNVLPLLVSEGDIPMQETALQKQQAIAADSDQPARQLLQKELQEYTRAEQSIQEQMRALEREKRELQQACEELRRQNAALQKPELDQLLSFLPAIFLDFWNVVRPDELANLADRLDVPNVPSPYLQLSQAAVVQKKKEFELLPADRQQKILQFCTTLSGSYTELKLHYEFRDFI